MNPGKNLSILHFTTASEPIAGAERVLLDLAEAAPAKWNLMLLTLRPEGELQRKFRALGYSTESLNAKAPSDSPKVLFQLRRLLLREQPDLLHTHLHHASVLGSAAASLHRGVALVQTRHYSDYMRRFGGGISAALDAWAARRCDRVAAVSQPALEQLKSEGVHPRRLAVVPNGIDVARLASLPREAGRAALRTEGVPDGPVVGCAATFHPIKGHRLLLEAFSYLHAKLPTAQLVLLGHGTDDPILKRHAALLGCAGAVHGLGFQPLGQRMMAGFDVYVQPSVDEGFGLAVVEAMAMGLPVVASAVGGLRVTVQQGETGLLVPPGDAQALATALMDVLLDGSLARRLGEAGAERARSNYGRDRMVEGYDQLYSAALQNREQPETLLESARMTA